MRAWISKILARGKSSESPVPALSISEVLSYEDYNHHAHENRETDLANRSFEKNLIPDNCSEFKYNGYCFICRTYVDLLVDFEYAYKLDGVLTPNWRERLVCPGCHLNNRMRAVVHIFNQSCQPNYKSSIYITEQTTALYKLFEHSFPYVCGSEYLGDSVDYGTCNSQGIRNEDLTELSFDNDKFDYILSFDVFEHIPNYTKALAECCRCLKPGGMLFFSVPFVKTSEKNIVRAQVSNTGEVIHLLPPEYHGDPLHSDGCLSFYHFGWEILDELNAMRFKDVKALLYWSRELGYLGGEQVIFVATKCTSAVEDKNRLYDIQTLAVMKRVLQIDSNCVDVGCHQGSILREMLRFAPKGTYFAFEPLPEMYQGLLESFGSLANIHLYDYALSDTAGTTSFQYVVSNPGYSGFRQRRYDRPHEQIQQITVKTNMLDNLVPKHISIQFIKVDVEGAELEVFKGAIETIKRSRPIIVFEHGLGAADYYGTTPESIYDLLAIQCGLKLFLMAEWLESNGGVSLNRKAFCEQFSSGNYYFMAAP